VIADDAEPVAELGLARSYHRDIDERASAIDAEVQRAERHNCIIALALRQKINRMEIGGYQLDFGRGQPLKGDGLTEMITTSTSAVE
jgi:hypothetical protein